MTLGSLFDGIGGFPLAAVRHGITPLWASEIESAPVSITKRHFPGMKHLGDITKINGAAIEPVDIISFGSPCQDLSNAGLRAGLEGSQSGLFFEAVRIIKEMRGATGGKQPERIIWENVPGAFSSSNGEDFRTVLETIAAIKGDSIPRPPAGWLSAGAVMGDNWSLAWRTLDAQYWGVPQRRRRIFLVADFGGLRAGEILFKPESLCGDTAEGGTAGKGTAGHAQDGTGKTGFNGVAVAFDGYNQTAGDKVQCLRSERADADHQGIVMILNDQGGNNVEKEDISLCLRSEKHGNLPVVSVFENHGGDSRITGPLDVAPTLSQRMGTGGNNVPLAMRQAVRRLTPTECERLQGFPDGWTEYGHDGKVISDSRRYMALGNSVAVPCVEFIVSRMAEGI